MKRNSQSPLSVRVGIRLLSALLLFGTAVVSLSLISAVFPRFLDLPFVRPSTVWAVCAVAAPAYFLTLMIGLWGEGAVESVSVFIWMVSVTPFIMGITFALFHRLTGMGSLYGKTMGFSLAVIGVLCLWTYVKDVPERWKMGS